MLTLEQSNTGKQGTREARAGLLTEEEKWKAVLARDESYDGLFVLAVRSTGIYCRPSCPARRPGRAQTVFFPGPDEAEQSGFRPCRRCRPRDTGPPRRAELVDRVSKYIEANLNKKLTLANLSIHAGISPWHLQRTFKLALSISPREYVEARRLAKMKRSLRHGETVTNAIYGAGFTSRSRLYEKVPNQLGVNPGTLRRGGRGLQIEYTIMDSPLGRLLVGSTEQGICAVCMGDSDEAVETVLSEDYPAAKLRRNDEAMRKWATSFTNYFTGQHPNLNLPINLQATAFQRRVWREIQSIPYGETTTYSRIARALGAPQATRAVARACATNPVALVVPCHRVIGEDGDLHGYRYGEKRKQALLSLEQESRKENARGKPETLHAPDKP